MLRMGVCGGRGLVSPCQIGGMLEVTPLCSCHLCPRAGLGHELFITQAALPRFSDHFGPWESSGSVLPLEALAGLCLPRKVPVKAADTTGSLRAAGHPSILFCLLPESVQLSLAEVQEKFHVFLLCLGSPVPQAWLWVPQ